MPNTKLAHSPAERALALMRALGIPNSASTLYVTLLQASALPTEKAAEMAGLTPAATKQAMEYLKLFRLVAQDVVHGEAVLFAGDPRTAWKAHDADFYWAHSNHIGDIETLPPLSGVADEKRRRLYAELEELCGSIYDVNPHSHDPLSHQHRDIYSGEMFASWLAAAISAAEKEIVAVEKPPRLPDLAPIWVALTRRIREGVAYTRIVGFDEILEHGLDIVTRDMDAYGINLRIARRGIVNESYYVIDNKRLLVKNARGVERADRGQHFGVYTSKRPIVRRYAARYSARYLPASDSARSTIERLRQHVERVKRNLLADGRSKNSEVFERVACYGKFLVTQSADAAVIDRLIASGELVKNPSGYVVVSARPQENAAD